MLPLLATLAAVSAVHIRLHPAYSRPTATNLVNTAKQWWWERVVVMVVVVEEVVGGGDG